MINVAAFAFNPFQENTYVISAENGECIIVDPGNYTAAEDAALSKYIETKKLTPKMIVCTHGHIDHVLGAQYLKDTYDIPMAVHSADNFLLESTPQHGAVYGLNLDKAPLAEIDLAQMKEIDLGGNTIEILNTPGHSPGHVSLFIKDQNLLLTGDTLFRESIGRTDLPGGDYPTIMNSIFKVILPLGDSVTVHPGHGPATTTGSEALYNPFIVDVLNGQTKF